MSDSTLHIAYALIKSGRKALARGLLMPLLQENPNHTDGWWLLAHAVEHDHQARHALLQVLRLRPSDLRAAQKLVQLNRDVLVEQNRVLRGDRPIEVLSPAPTEDLFAGLAAEPERLDLPPDSPFRVDRFAFDSPATRAPIRMIGENDLFTDLPDSALGDGLLQSDPLLDADDPFTDLHHADHVHMRRTQTFEFPTLELAGDPFAGVIPRAAPPPAKAVRRTTASLQTKAAPRRSSFAWTAPTLLLSGLLLVLAVWALRQFQTPLQSWCGGVPVTSVSSDTLPGRAAERGRLHYGAILEERFTQELPQHSYWFEGQAGRSVRVVLSGLEPEVLPRVVLFFSGQPLAACSAEGTARLDTRLPYTGRYYVRLEGGAPGNYRLQVLDLGG